MDYYDFNNQNESNEEQKEQLKMIEEVKKVDKGFNRIYRTQRNKNNKVVRKSINLYSSGGTGSQIRDAETGFYYPEMVGSEAEDLYFKVRLATGECNSVNGSTSFFYASPRHYMSHLNSELDEGILQKWEEKHSAYILGTKC